ncbi:apolipoprotein N-acyltransferase [Qipengyuania marisflavi]|uniref:Apolipoprotein N-acyltransferase n=2 Tax=Qipengyuania marisflavi TaxID=2486356 RepID=A0A5S3P1J2_9SPHN|nr:apolipoprotein N-acyltransferase [Qipengyuania marisflavi]
MGGFVALVWRSDTWRSAFLRGWLFGLAHFTLTDNWIATAFTYQAEMPAILGWAAVPLLSLYLAIFPAIAALVAWLAARKGTLPGFALALGAGWVLAEWLRSWVFSGYSWGPFSLALVGPWDRAGLAAVLPWFGTYALSGVAVTAAGLVIWLLRERRWIALGASVLALTAGMLWPAGNGAQGTVNLTLVQPNLRQDEIDDPSRFESQFATIASLSLPREPGPRLVLWPESGVPDYLREGYPQRYYTQMTAGADPAFARRQIAQVIGADSLLLTGAVDLEIGTEDGREQAVGAYNSVTALDGRGALVGHYAKSHLVPYGEYLPLRGLLEPLGASRLVAGSIDFIAGPGPRTLDFGMHGKAGMQICYEIVFSGEVADRANRPDYIFNPSNDGWFGSWGPPQHLGQARMRAIEEGLPVLRSTTTGISAIIDARGVVRDHIGMNTADRMDTVIPPPLPPTLFARLGHWLTLAWALVLFGASLVVMRRTPR